VIGARLGAGREAEVFAWGDDAVVKLYRPGFQAHREATVLADLDGRGLAPALLDTVEHDGRTGLLLERLGGPDMLTLLQRKPLRLLEFARKLAEAHLAVHQTDAPRSLPDLRQALTARIESAAMPPRLRDHALRTLAGLPDGERVCHGDYHPGNVLVTDGRVAVIDWVNATRGAPDADHARTLLLLRRGDPLPGTPLPVRALMAAGRSAFARRYARVYAAGSPQPVRQVDGWLVVHAAARLAEGIDAERDALIAVVQQAVRRKG
jgi:aminoglycoside phosphotransferase (APT) family kinase protein